MEKKEIIVALINGLLSYLFTLKDWAFYIAFGWKVETIITVIIGAIVGTYFATRCRPKEFWIWIALPVAMVFFMVLYSNLLDSPHLSLWKVLLGLWVLLGFIMIASYIIAFFELELLKVFSPSKATKEGRNL